MWGTLVVIKDDVYDYWRRGECSCKRLESAAEANGILMSYETYAHVQDMVEVEQKEAIKMKGLIER